MNGGSFWPREVSPVEPADWVSAACAASSAAAVPVGLLDVLSGTG